MEGLEPDVVDARSIGSGRCCWKGIGYVVNWIRTSLLEWDWIQMSFLEGDWIRTLLLEGTSIERLERTLEATSILEGLDPMLLLEGLDPMT